MPENPELPVTAVTLFASGVACIEREGPVGPGETEVALSFRTPQINDVLKSMVILDPQGGIRPAVYPSQEPVARTLQSFAVDVMAADSRAGLLRQLRGVPVHVVNVAGESLDGPVVSVETRTRAVGEIETEETILTLLTDNGLASLSLEKVATLTIRDERRARELREALAALAGGADDARRSVHLHFADGPARVVRVACIVEAPLWKMTYRLVLSEGAKPYLQGWALVENTTDDDWDGVRLSLVSGRPISFTQDLYRPIYIQRPDVPVDIIGAPAPRVHAPDMLAGGALPPPAPMQAPAAAKARLLSRQRMDTYADDSSASSFFGADDFALEAQATGEASGALFRYNISAPVVLPRQQAAMLPVVSADAGGERLSLFDADTDSRRPLAAVRLMNDTGLHLKGGPVTLFEDGLYAGDARMEDVPPGASRLLTYAVDLAIEGERLAPSIAEVAAGFSARRGALTTTRRRRWSTIYRFKSSASTDRVVLVEHSFQADWELVDTAPPVERTRDRYRFAVTVPAGGSAELPVVLERTDVSTVTLIDTDLPNLVQITAHGELSPKMQEALKVTVARRRKIVEREEAAAARDRERETLHTEQERIRANMTALDRETPLYRRYVEELDTQEARLRTLRDEATRLRDEARTAHDELRTYLESLDV